MEGRHRGPDAGGPEAEVPARARALKDTFAALPQLTVVVQAVPGGRQEHGSRAPGETRSSQSGTDGRLLEVGSRTPTREGALSVSLKSLLTGKGEEGTNYFCGRE